VVENTPVDRHFPNLTEIDELGAEYSFDVRHRVNLKKAIAFFEPRSHPLCNVLWRRHVKFVYADNGNLAAET
jgi:hypothetical protein